MRVLHVVTYMGRGGLETMIMNYYRHIDRTKIQFDFLVHRQEEADYDAEILSMGGRIHRFDRLIPWSRSYRKKLTAFFRAHPEYSIVHVHQDCLSSVALQCAQEAGVPVRIAHCHNSGADKNLKYPIKLFYKRKIRQYSTQLLTCSRAAADWMFGPGNEATLLPNAIDLKSFEFNKSTRKRIRGVLGVNEKFVLGHVGRFSTVKNHEFLLLIMKRLVTENDNIILLLVGEGAEKERLETLTAQYGLKDHVKFLGLRADVNELLMGMDCFLFPSLYEGFPVSLIEAQAAGLPCIVSSRISSEASVCPGLIDFASIDQGIDPWILKIKEKIESGFNREIAYSQVKTSGFDIDEESINLETLYSQLMGSLV